MKEKIDVKDYAMANRDIHTTYVGEIVAAYVIK